MMVPMVRRRFPRSDYAHCFGVGLGIIFVCSQMLAQTDAVPRALPEIEARQHLIQKVEPIYPPIAAAARIEGDVVISVLIDAKGNIASERALSGPPLLQQAALDAVKKWHFTPFTENAALRTVSTTLTIPFPPESYIPQLTPDQEKADQAMSSLSDQCRSALKAQKAQDAMDLCKRALDMSFQAGDLTAGTQLGRLFSHQLYGHAMLMAEKPREALEQENLAVTEAVKHLTDKQIEYAEPFFWRAIVEANLEDTSSALRDFQIAEETMRRAIIDLPDMKEHYIAYLSAILKQHAALLDSMGRAADAEKLRAEAAAL